MAAYKSFHCNINIEGDIFFIFSIIKRLDQYDEFFPAFQSVVSELKRLLSEYFAQQQSRLNRLLYVVQQTLYSDMLLVKGIALSVIVV